jgi:hypothetical protein
MLTHSHTLYINMKYATCMKTYPRYGISKLLLNNCLEHFRRIFYLAKQFYLDKLKLTIYLAKDSLNNVV